MERAATALAHGADGVHFELAHAAAFDAAYLAERLPLAAAFVGYTVAQGPDELLGRLAAAGLRVHAATATWTQTTLDPHTNLLRATTEAMSAVLGGADSLAVGTFDSLFAAPNEFSGRLARNLSLVLLHPVLGRPGPAGAGRPGQPGDRHAGRRRYGEQPQQPVGHRLRLGPDRPQGRLRRALAQDG